MARVKEHETCEYCQFYEESGDHRVGRCRRYAPRGQLVLDPKAIGDDFTGYYLWPMVNSNEWCGEFSKWLR